MASLKQSPRDSDLSPGSMAETSPALTDVRTLHGNAGEVAADRSFAARVFANPVVRIVLGSLLVWIPAPLITKTAHALIPPPYGHVWPTLLAALLVWQAYRFFVLRIERRPISELSTPGALGELGSGLLVGLCMQALLFAVLWAFGVYRIQGVVAPSAGMLSVVPLYIGVALLEEFVGRGIWFGITRRALGTVWAVVISSMFFGLIHAPNVGANPIGLLTCTAFGMLFAAAYMATGRLWLCIGVHFAWNFAQSQVFSSLVSGTSDGVGLVQGRLVGPEWLTGGSFGSEGSVVALAAALLGFLGFMALARARALDPVGRSPRLVPGNVHSEASEHATARPAA